MTTIHTFDNQDGASTLDAAKGVGGRVVVVVAVPLCPNRGETPMRNARVHMRICKRNGINAPGIRPAGAPARRWEC